MAQDLDGYLWIGTQSGLSRFDGVHFVNFTPRNTPALPGPVVNALRADPQGRLWIGTYKGLAVHHDQAFQRIATPGGVDLGVHAIISPEPEAVWVATDQGVYEVEDDRLVLRLATPKTAQTLLWSGDTLWIGSEGGVYVNDSQGLRFEPLGGAEGAVVDVLAWSQKQLWAATSAGLYRRVNGRWQAFSMGSLGSAPITMLLEDHDGNLWVGAHRGLARIRDGRLVEMLRADQDPIIPDYYSALEDREGNLWLGSRSDGIARLWNGWTERFSKPDGLHSSIVWSIAPAGDGTLWVGTDDGVSQFREGRFTQRIPGDALPRPAAYTLLAEGPDLWIGTRGGLALWRHGKLTQPDAYAALSNQQVRGLLRDRDGVLWIASSAGLFRNRGTALERVVSADGSGPEALRTLLQRQDGSIVAGGPDGLHEYRDGVLRKLPIPNSAGGDVDVTSLLELPGGELLVGNLSQRLLSYTEGQWFEYQAQQGVPENAAFFMTPDRHAYLWVGGILGIYRVPLADLQGLRDGSLQQARGEFLVNEMGTPRNGQRGYCCNGAGTAKGWSQGEKIYLPSRDGVVLVRTDRIRKNPVPPTVKVEQVRYGDTVLLPRAGETLAIPRGERALRFDFTALSFQDPGSVNLIHRLHGFETQWQTLETPDLRSTRYTNLGPGDYVFEVRASNNAGVWSRDTAQLRVHIPPYFYETYAFIGLCLGAVLILMWAAMRRQRRSGQRRHDRLEMLVQQRTEALEAANRQLRELSTTDQLTDLRNRRYLMDQLPGDIGFYQRRAAHDPGRSALLLVLLDIDHFKSINDRYGHQAGDDALRLFARALVQQVRTADYIVRWGGEEFLVVFRPMPLAEMEGVLERLRAGIEAQRLTLGDGTQVQLTCSIGFVSVPLSAAVNAETHWQPLLELADQALYRVKSAGRNGWAGYYIDADLKMDVALQSGPLDAQALRRDGALRLVSSNPRLSGPV